MSEIADTELLAEIEERHKEALGGPYLHVETDQLKIGKRVLRENAHKLGEKQHVIALTEHMRLKEQLWRDDVPRLIEQLRATVSECKRSRKALSAADMELSSGGTLSAHRIIRAALIPEEQ